MRRCQQVVRSIRLVLDVPMTPASAAHALSTTENPIIKSWEALEEYEKKHTTSTCLPDNRE
eukprot:11015530-Prorocentrum_lima.AAC.1